MKMRGGERTEEVQRLMTKMEDAKVGDGEILVFEKTMPDETTKTLKLYFNKGVNGQPGEWQFNTVDKSGNEVEAKGTDIGFDGLGDVTKSDNEAVAMWLDNANYMLKPSVDANEVDEMDDLANSFGNMTLGGRRHRGSKKAHKKTRKGNKMLSSWVAFVKKVQRDEQISYSDAMKRASARKKEWKMGQMGGEVVPPPGTDPNMSSVEEDETMSGGRRRRRTKRRGSRKRRGTKRRR